MTIPTRNEISSPPAGGITRRIGARYHSVAITMMRPAGVYSMPGNQEKIARTISTRMKMLISVRSRPVKPPNIAG